MKTAERARGALYGLAIGDALGMPTQMLSRPAIRDRWGDLLTGFEPAPPGHPIAAGRPAGAVTDDTEQAVLLARLLVRGQGTIDPNELAAVPGDPWRACLLAASLGGDCDTIAAMAGAVAGACHGAGSFPPEAIAVIDAHGFGLPGLAAELLALRGRPGGGTR